MPNDGKNQPGPADGSETPGTNADAPNIAAEWGVKVTEPEAKAENPDEKKTDEQPGNVTPEKKTDETPGKSDEGGEKKPAEEKLAGKYNSVDDLVKGYGQQQRYISEQGQLLKNQGDEIQALKTQIEAMKTPEMKRAELKKASPELSAALDAVEDKFGEEGRTIFENILTLQGSLTAKPADSDKSNAENDAKLFTSWVDSHPEVKESGDLYDSIIDMQKDVVEHQNDANFMLDLLLHAVRGKNVEKIAGNLVAKLLPGAVEKELQRRIASGAVVGTSPASAGGAAVPPAQQELDAEWGIKK